MRPGQVIPSSSRHGRQRAPTGGKEKRRRSRIEEGRIWRPWSVDAKWTEGGVPDGVTPRWTCAVPGGRFCARILRAEGLFVVCCGLGHSPARDRALGIRTGKRRSGAYSQSTTSRESGGSGADGASRIPERGEGGNSVPCCWGLRAKPRNGFWARRASLASALDWPRPGQPLAPVHESEHTHSVWVFSEGSSSSGPRLAPLSSSASMSY